MRLSFDDMSSLQMQLFDRLCSGQITLHDYVEEWDKLVEFAGWTWAEVLTEVDSRWTKPSRPPPSAFLC